MSAFHPLRTFSAECLRATQGGYQASRYFCMRRQRMDADPKMEKKSVQASAWTGDLSDAVRETRGSSSRVGKPSGQQPLTVALALLAGALLFVLHSVTWHLIWVLSGSPAVYLVTRGIDALAFPLVAAVTYLLARHLKWALAIAVTVSSLAFSASSLVLFALDLQRSATSGEQRLFISSARAPRYPPKRRPRLQHTLHLVDGRGSIIEASVPALLFRSVIAGDSCVDVRWTGGRKYRFFRVIRWLPTGDGNGSWVNVPQDRARCLAAQAPTT
jgi:hypothetical protein